MRRTGYAAAMIVVSCFWIVPAVSAEPLGAYIDLSEIGGTDFLLSLQVFNQNGVIGDTHLIVDNVRLQIGSSLFSSVGLLDFEDGTLEGFSDDFNPGSVRNVPGGWDGARAMEMAENLVAGLVISERGIYAEEEAHLVFEFEFFGSLTEGLGFDTFVVQLLNPVTFEPVVAGLTGQGDIIEINATGISTAPGISVVPRNQLPIAVRSASWSQLKSNFAN